MIQSAFAMKLNLAGKYRGRLYFNNNKAHKNFLIVAQITLKG